MTMRGLHQLLLVSMFAAVCGCTQALNPAYYDSLEKAMRQGGRL